MKILLLGKNGQVGWELQRSLAPLGELLALDSKSTAYCGDLNNLPGIAATIRSFAPHVIVNAAAYTAVDKAESEPAQAQRINAEAVAVLAHEAQQLGAWLVHYSTDYVFDGSGATPWQETAAVGPLSVYGTSKLAGELAIQASGCKHLIFRTSWVYAARGNNFVKTMLRLAQERDSLNVIADQFGAPTGAELLADVTAHALRCVQQQPELAGLYHLAAAGETNWYSYARFVLEQAKA
ncbi:MAG: dTDP-4-dehydrorhamnose reductase, partial [Pseudomonas sp.]|nr:dTDP-4-dehydrorhamnose reductase [Pseudomonas sp.]